MSYYWPPSAGSGVQRWLKLTKYLDLYNWKAFVYTPENPDFNLQDETLMEDISPSVEVIKKKIFEPYALARLLTRKKDVNTGIVSEEKQKSGISKLLNWVRGNYFIPDPRVTWVKPSIKYLKKVIQKNSIDAIITTGPPHSMHLIGLGLKKEIRIPWIVDIRDPWSKLDFLNTFNLSDKSRSKYKQLEFEVMKHCDRVIGTSYSMHEMLVNVDRNKFFTVTNGFDENDFPKKQHSSHKSQSNEIVMYHAGLLNNLRNPSNLWDAIKRHNSQNGKKIKLHLCGTIDPLIQKEVTSLEGMEVKLEAYKTHQDVLEDYRKSDVLLLLVNKSDNSKVNIPGKIFEYFASTKTIIGFGKKDDDAIKMLKEAGMTTFDYEEEIDSEMFELALTKTPNLSDLKKYSRKSTSGQIAKILDNLIQSNEA